MDILGLYKAYKSKKLPESMKKMFCFDQFKWNDKTILAYEFFDEKQDEFLSVKHKFYVTDGNGKIEWFIQSESSMAVRQTKGKYILVSVKNSGYSSFWSYKFDEDFDYIPLKVQVLKILNNEIKPEGSTTINGK